MFNIIIDQFQLAAVFSFGLVLRMTFAISQSSDQWGVYTKLRKLSGKRWIDYSMPDALPVGIFPYPMLVHFLISRLPERIWKPVLVVFNLSCDLFVAAFVFGSVFSVLRDVDGAQGRVFDIATLAALVFLTMPILLPITARMRDCNGRAAGMVLNTLYLLCVYMAVSYNPLVFFPLGILVLVAVFLTSFFAMQTAVFFSAGLTLWLSSSLPLSMVAVSVLISFCLPRIGARDTLLFKVNHFIWYWRNAQKNTTATGRNLIGNLILFLRVFPRQRQKSIWLFYRSSPLLIALYSAPVFWLLLLMLCNADAWAAVSAKPFGNFCLGVSVISIAIFGLTSVGRLVIFGESERYFEYGAPFVCIAMAQVLFATLHGPARFMLLLSLVQVTIVLFNEMTYTHRFFRWLRDEPLFEAKAEQAVMQKLKQMGDGVRIATVPIKLPILLTAFNDTPESLRFYFRFMMQDRKLDGFRYYEEDTEDINIFSGTPERLTKKYGITHVLCQKSYLKPGTFNFIDALMTRRPVWEENGYALFRISLEDER